MIWLTVLAFAAVGIFAVRTQVSADSPSQMVTPSPVSQGVALPEVDLPSEETTADGTQSDHVPAGRPGRIPPGMADDALTAADGLVPEGVSIFDDRYSGVTNLDPTLLQALREAAIAARDEGIEIYVTSGWRSSAYQDWLWRAAVAQYGSEQEASRWVATADTSPHVWGNAIDLGPETAQLWLSENGADWGLCQIYGNEPWHFEYRGEALVGGCPAMYSDPTQDPRLHQ